MPVIACTMKQIKESRQNSWSIPGEKGCACSAGTPAESVSGSGDPGTGRPYGLYSCQTAPSTNKSSPSCTTCNSTNGDGGGPATTVPSAANSPAWHGQ